MLRASRLRLPTVEEISQEIGTGDLRVIQRLVNSIRGVSKWNFPKVERDENLAAGLILGIYRNWMLRKYPTMEGQAFVASALEEMAVVDAGIRGFKTPLVAAVEQMGWYADPGEHFSDGVLSELKNLPGAKGS